MATRREVLGGLLSVGGASLLPLRPRSQVGPVPAANDEWASFLRERRDHISSLQMEFSHSCLTSPAIQDTEPPLQGGVTSLFYEPTRYRILEAMHDYRFERRYDGGEYETRYAALGASPRQVRRVQAPPGRAPRAVLSRIVPQFPESALAAPLISSIDGSLRASSRDVSVRIDPHLGAITQLARGLLLLTWAEFASFAGGVILPCRMVFAQCTAHGDIALRQELRATTVVVNETLPDRAFAMTLEAQND